MPKQFFYLPLFISSSIFATDTGAQGETVPIAERSMMEVIQEGLRNLSPKEKAKIKEKLIDQVKHPIPVSGIKEAAEYRSQVFDPSIQVSEEIKDANGNILVQKGTKMNPLEKITVKEQPLLFLDGTNPHHIAWAKTQAKEAKWILVKGSPLDVENSEAQVFFDQGGFLTDRFGITHVPCRVSEQGGKLLIEEIPVGLTQQRRK